MLKVPIVSVITAVIICICYFFYNEIRTLKQESSILKQEITMNAGYEAYASKNASFYIDDSINIVNSKFKDINKDSIFRKTNLIMRIPSLVCNPCYDTIFSIITKNIPIDKRDSFIIIVDLKVLKEYSMYYKKQGLFENIFAVKPNSFVSREMDNQPFPYLFRRKRNGKYNYLFVINKDSKIRLNEYLNIISNKSYMNK